MLRAKKGFTLLEIMVATIILSLIMAGLASIYFGAKRWVLHSRMRMQATELSKTYIDPLQRDVREDQWIPPSNCLSIGIAGCDNAPLPGGDLIENIRYGRQFDFVGAPPIPGSTMKKVRFTITWSENP